MIDIIDQTQTQCILNGGSRHGLLVLRVLICSVLDQLPLLLLTGLTFSIKIISIVNKVCQEMEWSGVVWCWVTYYTKIYYTQATLELAAGEKGSEVSDLFHYLTSIKPVLISPTFIQRSQASSLG